MKANAIANETKRLKAKAIATAVDWIRGYDTADEIKGNGKYNGSKGEGNDSKGVKMEK